VRRARGFTLLEVMVALAVLAVALGALIKAGSEAAANGASLRDRTYAHYVAQNLLADAELAESWPATGNRTGTVELGGQRWSWSLLVDKTADEDIRRLEVAVRLADGPEGGDQVREVAYVARH